MTPSSSSSLISFQSKSISRRIKRPPPVTILNSDLKRKAEDGRIIRRIRNQDPETREMMMEKGKARRRGREEVGEREIERRERERIREGRE